MGKGQRGDCVVWQDSQDRMNTSILITRSTLSGFEIDAFYIDLYNP